jgi:tellurite resistance protein TerC
VSLALAFNGAVYLWMGVEKGNEFLTGYVIEQSLSVDNVFVFAVVFSYFAVPAEYQHRVLFWGVLGAIVMRGIMVLAGVSLLERLDWAIFLFGGILVLTAIKLALQKEGDIDPERNLAVRAFRRFVPVHEGFEGQRFFVRRNGRLFATRLLLALVVIESTDLVFAIDSVPAVLAISQDPFIVYTSNMFAILGLRSLYFVVAGSLSRFHYLKYGLAGVLLFVGVKMLLSHTYHLPVVASLGVIVTILGAAVAASLWHTRRHAAEALAVEVPQGADERFG